jgi:two-component system OmpR family sensor kinase
MNNLLRRTPLRVKLVAAVLVLMAAAVAGLGIASAVAMHDFLLKRTDNELDRAAELVAGLNYEPMNQYGQPARESDGQLLPNNYLVGGLYRDTDNTLKWQALNMTGHRAEELPTVSPDAINELNTPFTVSSPAGLHWRVLLFTRANGNFYLVGEDLTNLESSVERLIAINIIGGVALLIILASAGAALVRKSLQPLAQIESTAAAIAAGDLTRRIPDPEPGPDPPQSEVGRLARSLNVMLAQIEAAFTARAASETAARAAESAARDAAEAAVVSESRARRSEEKMRQFVADASHELRTPLTTIRGFAELYRQGAATDPADVSRLLRRIEDEAARMGLLVEDMLLLARLDRERPLALAPVELRVIAADAISAARAVAPDRDITIEVAESSGPLVVSGDEHRLRQVVGNLMTNALRHTPAGTPVELKLRSEGGQGVLEVVDHGQGLDAEHAERVFERFYQADASRSRRNRGLPDPEETGTGLGLAIVAALVNAHEGVVDLTTAPGKGATFRIRLPLYHEVTEPAQLVSS